MMKQLARCIAMGAGALALAACGGGGGGGSSLYAGPGASGPTGGGTGSTGGGGISQVSTGVPTQRSMSLSAEKYALNWSFDGDVASITVRITDTAGNPVPDGTPVQFSTEGGQILTSCRLTGVTQGATTISACSVTFSTQNLRPLDGLVTILAWMEGQEAFIDLNGNGSFDSGEPFYESGRIYRDDNTNAIYSPGIDELNVGGTVASSPGLGTLPCGASPGYTETSFGFSSADPANFYLGTAPYSVPDTCDGQWGRTLVRGSVTFPVSDPRVMQILVSGPREVVLFSDFALASGSSSNPTAAPAGTTVSVVAPPAGCTIVITPPAVSVTAVAPTFHTLVTTGTCSGSVTVKAAFGDIETSVVVPLP